MWMTNDSEADPENRTRTLEEEEDRGGDQLNWSAVVTGLSLCLIIAFTLFGNCLVVLSVVLFRPLRSLTTNHFVVSLAVADLAVGLLVMPPSVVYQVEGKWRLGWTLCHFWMSCDVTSCTASILHLCVISVDRYVTITEPLTYRSRVSRRRAMLVIFAVWGCSGAISFVPLFLGWSRDDDDDDDGGTSCQIRPNWKYAVASSVTSFYLPLVVMTTVYVRIFRIARRQAAEIEFMEKNFFRRKRLRRDLKAVRTLGTLMGLFCLCWVPFFFVYLLGPICGPPCQPDLEAEAAITWLGYCNSFVNPCVYALMNRDFRTAFRKILRCRCRRRRRHPPEADVSADSVTSSASSLRRASRKLSGEIRLRVFRRENSAVKSTAVRVTSSHILKSSNN